jgi:D-alanyl-D-alanine carboxypeptidase
MLARTLRPLFVLAALLPLACSSAVPGDDAAESAWENVDGLDDQALQWVNKERCLPCGFVPAGLVSVDAYGASGGDRSLTVRDFVQAPLQKMLADARAATGDSVVIASAYRSYALQVRVLENESVNPAIGPCQAARQVAAPGRSEHQLGVAVDLGVAAGPSGAGYLDAFGRTAGGRWIRANAWKYGFALSYPEGRESITGYRHESWHYRFVGKSAAKKIFDNQWSVEEFFRAERPRTTMLPGTCEACDAARGALSGCPSNTHEVFTCGAGVTAGRRVKCNLGLITCETCAGGVCDARPTGQDDVCRNGVETNACPEGTSPIWTCTGDGKARTRCVNGKVETETCAAGCVARPTGTDDVCGCPYGVSSPIWTCNGAGTERRRCVDGAYQAETCANGCKANPPGTDDTCR